MGKLRPRLVIGLSHKSHKKPTMSGLFLTLIFSCMNYQQYIEHEYTPSIPSVEQGHNYTYCYLGDGSGFGFADYDFDLNSWDLLPYLYYVSNLYNTEHSSHGGLMGFQLFAYENRFDSFIFLNSSIDYIVFGSSAVYAGVSYDDYQGDVITDPNVINNYSTTNARGFTNYTYGSFTGSLNNSYAVFDLTNIKSEELYFNENIVIRGENMSFSKYSVRQTNYQSGFNYFAYGRPLYYQRQSEFQRGYDHGRTSGYIDGYDNGLADGISQGGTDGQTQTAFNYIGGAFGAVGNILSIEVLPHVTIGLCFSIPLVFVLIMTIFKLIRK